MEINIKMEDENIMITESEGCKESEVINIYAIALAMKCEHMFEKKEDAIALLEKAHELSKQTIDNMYFMKEGKDNE